MIDTHVIFMVAEESHPQTPMCTAYMRIWERSRDACTIQHIAMGTGQKELYCVHLQLYHMYIPGKNCSRCCGHSDGRLPGTG